MIYNYLISELFGNKETILLTNDLVLAKKCLFNRLVEYLENLTGDVKNIKYRQFKDAREDELTEDNVVDDWRGFYTKLEKEFNEKSQEDILNIIIPRYHKEIEEYWAALGYADICEVTGTGRYMRFDDDGDDNVYNMYEFDIDCAIGYCSEVEYDEDEDGSGEWINLGNKLVPFDAEAIELDYEANRRKYGISDTFTEFLTPIIKSRRKQLF